jgi:hypothetical protein
MSALCRYLEFKDVGEVRIVDLEIVRGQLGDALLSDTLIRMSA